MAVAIKRLKPSLGSPRTLSFPTHLTENQHDLNMSSPRGSESEPSNPAAAKEHGKHPQHQISIAWPHLLGPPSPTDPVSAVASCATSCTRDAESHIHPCGGGGGGDTSTCDSTFYNGAFFISRMEPTMGGWAGTQPPFPSQSFNEVRSAVLWRWRGAGRGARMRPSAPPGAARRPTAGAQSAGRASRPAGSSPSADQQLGPGPREQSCMML
jgi:hypothetical protein